MDFLGFEEEENLDDEVDEEKNESNTSIPILPQRSFIPLIHEPTNIEKIENKNFRPVLQMSLKLVGFSVCGGILFSNLRNFSKFCSQPYFYLGNSTVGSKQSITLAKHFWEGRKKRQERAYTISLLKMTSTFLGIYVFISYSNLFESGFAKVTAAGFLLGSIFNLKSGLTHCIGTGLIMGSFCALYSSYLRFLPDKPHWVNINMSTRGTKPIPKYTYGIEPSNKPMIISNNEIKQQQ